MLNQNNALGIAYQATTDAPTVVNFTNHTYFNLAGEGSGDIYDQKLAINSNTFQPDRREPDPDRVRTRWPARRSTSGR